MTDPIDSNTDEEREPATEATGERGAESRSRSAFVLGFDGVPWNLIERWARAGELPNFARLFEEGATGPLRSTAPATTPLAWPSIATGTRPDKHGIYGFQKLSTEYTHRMYTSADLREPTLWDILGPALVGNVPMTYPPRAIDGRLVSGMMTPSLDDRFTHPPELAAEIGERIPEYRIGLDWSEYAGRTEAFVADLGDLLRARRELMHLLLEAEDWRLCFFVYTEPDRLQHLVWDEDVLLDFYRELDAVLGEVVEHVRANEALLCVVSDHGFGPISKLVSVNRLLEREGYLARRTESGSRGVLSRFGISRDGVQAALSKVGISDQWLVDHLPRTLVDRVASGLPGTHALYDVDHANTVAFFHSPGAIYVNDTRRFSKGCVDPAAVPDVKRELTALLSTYADPAADELALVVHDGEELFPTDDWAPDLVVEGREGYEPQASLTDRVLTDAGAKVASHRSEGIFLAWGPDVAAGVAPENASVVDVAPTVLHALGESVPRNADGRILEEVFDPDSAPARQPVTERAYARSESDAGSAADEDFERVEDRLRGLGYLE